MEYNSVNVLKTYLSCKFIVHKSINAFLFIFNLKAGEWLVLSTNAMHTGDTIYKAPKKPYTHIHT